MAFSSKPLFHLKTLKPTPFHHHYRYLRPRAHPTSLLTLRLLSFATPEEAAAERRRRKRRLRIEPPLSSLRQSQQSQQQQRPRPNSRNPPGQNPNTPKLPEPVTVLTGNRLNLHNRILTLIRENDLDEAALLTRHSIYSNCRPTVFTCNAVMAAQLRQCRHADMLSLHRFITQAGVAPTVITHNLLFQAYCDVRKTDTALEHFRIFVNDSPVNPSPTTYRILMKGLVDNNKLDQAVELKEDMITRGVCQPDPIVYNLLMSGFVKIGESEKVVTLFEELKEKLGGGTVCDGAVYGNLMKGYFGKGMEDRAMEIYKEALGQGSLVRFTAVSYNSVLEALSCNEKYEEAMGLFNRMMEEHDAPRKITVNVGTFNVMVDGFCLQGKFDEAIEMFGRMGEKKCVPDTLSYNNLIDQLGRNGKVVQAEDLFREMIERTINPDEYTYVLLVEACFEDGRADDAVSYFRKMIDVGLRPNAAAHNKVVCGMVKAGRTDEAKVFFDQMLEKEVKPNIDSYDILLRAFIETDRLDEALKTFKDTLMDEGVVMTEEMKDLMTEKMKSEGRDAELEQLYKDVEREKAEALARAEEEKARVEAAAREEEERKKAEAAEKAEAAARASRATIEAILGKKKATTEEEGEILEPSPGTAVKEGAGIGYAEEAIGEKMLSSKGGDIGSDILLTEEIEEDTVLSLAGDDSELVEADTSVKAVSSSSSSSSSSDEETTAEETSGPEKLST